MKTVVLARFALALALTSVTQPVWAEPLTAPLSITLDPAKPGPAISRYLFGQFAEHLGTGIYGGVWVGPDSPIPNTRGIRNDVVQALRAIKVPDVRWPGGCFAEEYHWRDGVGPRNKRPVTLNSNWGGVTEPNSFGTDEFMDFVGQIGADPYVTVNVGSGSPAEAAAWLEYMTTDQPTTLGQARVANGHRAPYRLPFLGIGNESWGCGGAMNAASYVNRMKVFDTFLHNHNPAQAYQTELARGPDAMKRIAVGPNDADPEYTEGVMSAWAARLPWTWNIEGLSLHNYTWGDVPMSAPATNFTEKQYFDFVRETYRMDADIAKHSAIMDKYDPQKRVALVVDEWGAWLMAAAGTKPMFLRQDNSLRDAITASVNLDIFARHADRVRMANIAQMVNVLQALILTDGPRMVLTPTYYVFKLYLPFQDSEQIPVSLSAGQYVLGSTGLPRIDAIAAKGKDGRLWLAVTNIDPERAADVEVNGVIFQSEVGDVLTGLGFNEGNSFATPNAVAPAPFNARASGGRLSLHLPPASVTVVNLDGAETGR